jgi:hypothetical protein
VALRDSMRDSAAQYPRPGEPVQAVIGAQTASAWLAGLTGFLVFLNLNKYRIIAVTPTRIVDTPPLLQGSRGRGLLAHDGLMTP